MIFLLKILFNNKYLNILSKKLSRMQHARCQVGKGGVVFLIPHGQLRNFESTISKIIKKHKQGQNN